ncbi:hypothetical protein LTR70_010059 [Exophiala xenobiotica]|uniref:Uncharacterized protein n=1 Tax=Lithohypha guttulata TaxID=1690604 RepID=A0ABR0JVD2_9EURO|nr:hypothetical protein LTR24_009964 [Lithohypha guttulata]KAK5309720.1 hypothetical protein LTR70_010059 [Exophiala xenobiotica]
MNAPGEAHQALCGSIDSLSMACEETDIMVNHDNDFVRAHFRKIEQNFHPVLEMLEWYQARIRDRRASHTAVESTRTGLTVLRRWLIHAQHRVDITRDRILLGVEDEAVDWRMFGDVTPVVSMPTAVRKSLHNVLVQLQNMPPILATRQASDCWKTSTRESGNLRGATQLFSRQLRTRLKSIERHLTKIRIMTLVLSDLLASLGDREAYGTSKTFEGCENGDKIEELA